MRPRSARSNSIHEPPVDKSTDAPFTDVLCDGGCAAGGAVRSENKISTGILRAGAAVSSFRFVLCRIDASACAASAPPVFLGRGGLLHSGRARLISDRHAHSADRGIECASSA